MSSTKYPCYDSPVHIPGVPGVFSNIIVEVDDVTREVLSLTSLPGIAVAPDDPNTSPQPSTPKETKASDAAKVPFDTPKSKE